MAPVTAPARPARVTYRDVFAVREFTVLWAAQLASIAGDQFARIALTVLVYDRTRSGLLAAATFTASMLPMCLGGIGLSWLADRYPRRTVMVACDAVSFVLVLIMAIRGMPLAVLVALLAAVSLVSAPFASARGAANRDVLGAEAYPLGMAVTLSTYQAGQVAGFAVGGVLTGLAGPRGALLADAATFAASAALILAGVRSRPAGNPAAQLEGSQLLTGLRAVLSSRVARLSLLAGWLPAFVAVTDGIAVPLAHSLGGGPVTAGCLLAATAAGVTAGLLLWPRLVPATRGTRLAVLLAGISAAVLAGFAGRPPLAGALALLAVSGAFTCYMTSANAVFAEAVPAEHLGAAFGVGNAGIMAGQSLAIVAAGAMLTWLTPPAVIAVWGGLGVLAALALAGPWHRQLGAGTA